MFLAFDIGNSNIKTGLFDGDELTGYNVFSSPDDLISGLTAENINAAAVSSVVPGLTLKVQELVKEKFNRPAYIISKESRFNLKLNYDTPETLV